jgi:small-conductance mechanosensitive channel
LYDSLAQCVQFLLLSIDHIAQFHIGRFEKGDLGFEAFDYGIHEFIQNFGVYGTSHDGPRLLTEIADLSFRASAMSRRLIAILNIALIPALAIGVRAADDSKEAALPDSTALVQFLDATIDWQRQHAEQQKIATESSDVIEISQMRQTAEQIVRLAFEFARAAAPMIDTRRPAAPDAGAGEFQSLVQWKGRLDRQIRSIQDEMDSDRKKLAAATGKRRQVLQLQLSELEAELELATTRRDAMRNIVEFASTSNAGALSGGLPSQIETLAGSATTSAPTPATGTPVPSTAAASTTTASAETANRLDTSSIWDSGTVVAALSSKVKRIDAQREQTTSLLNNAKEIRAPFVYRLTDLSKQGDQLAVQADTANEKELADDRRQLDALVVQFKQISAAILPLNKQIVLLDLYQKSLERWRQSVSDDYTSQLRALGLRIALLVGTLVVVFVVASLWRRAVYRYVRDARRRYQFLLLRRFMLGFVIAIILAVAFVSRLDSFVTFAGLITAGVAVALQNVIVSIVGYFFLIGKHGIRVGDRVKIGDVFGEVIDIGLVRLHLMELHGGLSGPTGRVVAFSNSVVFQSSAGLFKQLPGINFTWHEITLMLAAGADFMTIKDRLLKVVKAVLANYQEEIDRQNREIEATAIIASDTKLRPHIQLRYMSGGVEAAIRYPVDMQHATEIDERITQELLHELDREPKLKLAGGLPDLKLHTDVMAA